MKLAVFFYLFLLALIIAGFVFIPIWTGSILLFFVLSALIMIRNANKAPVIEDEEMNF